MKALSRMDVVVRKTRLIIAAGAFLALLMAGCAGQQAPQGGPVDTEPPEVASVYPAPNTVNFKDTRVAIEFSEYVDRASVENAVFISPYVSEIEFEWSGREVEIVFQSGLKSNTTYVLTLGTDVIDYNAHNRMAKAFTLAFSTGGAIDRGAIRGRVVDEKPEGVMLFAYRLDGLRADTLNPAVTKPDYITQTGATGTYALTHLAFGTYRVYAVRDEYRDLLYTPEVDAAGTLTSDVALSERDTLASGCDFTLALEDTSAPRLLSVEARDRRHVTLRFSEALDTSHLAPAMIEITDTLSMKKLEVTSLFPENSAQPVALVARTAEQTAGAGYRLQAAELRDRAGHRVLPSASMLDFRGSERPDTLAPVLVAQTLRDTTSAVMLDERFRFDFTDAVSSSALHAFSFSLGDSLDVAFTLRRQSDAGLLLVPGALLRPKARYVIHMRYDSVKSVSGAGLKDSVRTFRYTTIDPENFSSIDGVVRAARLADTSTTVVEAFNLADKTAVVKRVTASKDRAFSFPLLGEGTYELRAFSDYNKNGVLDAGRVYPFRASEPFTIGRDTVKVRPRWPVEGVVVR